MDNSARFKKLLEPSHIGSVRTRNRILKMGSHPGFFEYTDGYVHEKIRDFYEAIARGGAGLVTVGAASIDYPLGLSPNRGYRIDDDKYVTGLNELVQAIRKYGCPALIQMFHIGPMLRADVAGQQPVSASSLSKHELPRPQFEVPRELTITEIEEMVDKFAGAAVRAQKAGFEGIELNAACNHLLNSFLSRAWNKRKDAYGYDSPESRAHFMVEIIREVKKRAGHDFAIVALINGAEIGLDNGITVEESCEFARILQSAGVDAIHVRVEFYTRPRDTGLRTSTHFPDIALYPEIPKSLGQEIDISRFGAGAWVPPAAAIKKVVSIPVIAVGRLDPELGERLLRCGMVDFISLNRRLMADPELPNKVALGRLEDITPCTGCLTCFNAVETGQPPRCQVNATLGREREYEIKPAVQKKRVMIVGGGPAGMEAARVAALRGHEVILYDREHKLGGLLPLAAMIKGFEREDVMGLVCYLKNQITKLGVKVRLGEEVSRALVKEIKPDVLIIAAGGIHDVPALPGINKHNVITSRNLHHRLKTYSRFIGPRVLRWLTKFWMPLGKRVVIMGGDIQGCEVAEFLVKRGRKVTIVHTAKEIGNGLVETLVKLQLLVWLIEKEVPMLTEVKYEEIADNGLTITTKEGTRQTIAADTIVTAMPLQPNTELIKSLEGEVPEVYPIGDCREPLLIVDAIAEGSRIARSI